MHKLLLLFVFFVQNYNDAEICTHWKSVVTPSRNLSKNCLANCFNFALHVVAMSDAHTARPHWLPASVCLAESTEFLLTFRDNNVLRSLPCIIHSLCGHARKSRIDYCKIVRRSSVDWNVMCLSLELDFEKFIRKNYCMLAASDGISYASCACAVSVPTTPT